MKNVIFIFLSAIFISLGTNLMSKGGSPTPACKDLEAKCSEASSPDAPECKEYRQMCKPRVGVPSKDFESQIEKRMGVKSWQSFFGKTK